MPWSRVLVFRLLGGHLQVTRLGANESGYSSQLTSEFPNIVSYSPSTGK